MKCLDDCHNYELDTFMAAEKSKPILTFYQMIGEAKIDGVTNEEIIKVLIHRITYLNEEHEGGKFKCFFNTEAIKNLTTALALLNRRTTDREERKVEGTHDV